MFTWNTNESGPTSYEKYSTIRLIILTNQGYVKDISFTYMLESWEDVVRIYDIDKWIFYDILVN